MTAANSPLDEALVASEGVLPPIFVPAPGVVRRAQVHRCLQR